MNSRKKTGIIPYFTIMLTFFSCLTTQEMDAPNKLLFIGDSHIKRWDIAFHFNNQDFFNGGIGGDEISDLLEEIKDNENWNGDSFQQCFVQIGTNDIRMLFKANLSDQEIKQRLIERYQVLLEMLSRREMDTNIISILPRKNPTNRELNELIRNINKELSNMTASYQNIQFIDAQPILGDEKNILRSEYSLDGLHLTIEGYNALSKLIVKYTK